MRKSFTIKSYLVTVVALCSISFSQDMQTLKEVTEYQKKYNYDFLAKNSIEALMEEVQRDINEANNKRGYSSDSMVGVFLQLWKIKSYFLNGKIKESKQFFKDLEESTKIDTSSWRKHLFHKPFSFETYRCSENGCLCKMIDPKYSNIDFLDDYQFRQHFKDLSIEFGDENSKVIDVIKRSVVRGKSGEIIEILMDPPNIKSKERSYSLDFNDEELLEYYFGLAKKHRFSDLESYYTENKPFFINADKDIVTTTYKLQFEDSYSSKEDRWKMKIRYLPTNMEFPEDVNRTYYKFYIKDGEDIIERYSYALIYEEIYEEEELEMGDASSLDEASLLIRWNEDWDIQEMKDKGHILFLFPARYITPGLESAFKIGTIPLFNSDKLSSKKYIISETYDSELLKNYDSELLKEKFGDSFGNKTIKVYQVDVVFKKDAPDNEIVLEFTRDYSLFKEEDDAIKKQMKIFMIVFSICLTLLVGVPLL